MLARELDSLLEILLCRTACLYLTEFLWIVWSGLNSSMIYFTYVLLSVWSCNRKNWDSPCLEECEVLISKLSSKFTVLAPLKLKYCFVLYKTRVPFSERRLVGNEVQYKETAKSSYQWHTAWTKSPKDWSQIGLHFKSACKTPWLE